MNQRKSLIYLIPTVLDDEAIQTIPLYIADAVKDCQIFFVENERTARRFLKKFWKLCLPGEQLVLDNYEWFAIEKAEEQVQSVFRQKIKEEKNIGIISEAGCPGVADPGQSLIAIAHQLNVVVKPLVGPSSILLALMASGMNGQQFHFAGYLPINEHERMKAIRDLEMESLKKKCTQIFIETPYRNNQLIESIFKACRPGTKLCIAANLTSQQEWIKTMTITEWKRHKIDFHKKPAIFLLLA